MNFNDVGNYLPILVIRSLSTDQSCFCISVMRTHELKMKVTEPIFSQFFLEADDDDHEIGSLHQLTYSRHVFGRVTESAPDPGIGCLKNYF